MHLVEFDEQTPWLGTYYTVLFPHYETIQDGPELSELLNYVPFYLIPLLL